MEYTKACVICKKEFVTKSYNALVCSKPCKNKYKVIWNRMDRGRKPGKERFGPCPVCGLNVLLPPKVSSICCSEECRTVSQKSRFEKYNKNNPEKRKETYRKSNNSEKRKNWKEDNKDSIKFRMKKWREENKGSLLKKQRDRYKNIPEVRLRVIIRGHLRRMVSRKQQATHDYMDYSYRDLVNHLQSLFTVGMSWANYGEWHIDHKKPLCKFSFINQDGSENIVEIKKAMSLSNLQPLWAEENMKKSGKYPIAV